MSSVTQTLWPSRVCRSEPHTCCLLLCDAILACIASGRGPQLVPLAQTLTQPQHRGQPQSRRIAPYVCLTDTAHIECTMKCQFTAQRTLRINQQSSLSHGSHTHRLPHTIQYSLFKMTLCRLSGDIFEINLLLKG